jgi:probable phosphoglycerate mutase
MFLIVVRHGECVANAQNVIAGAEDDSPLTELGRQQAADAAARLAKEGVEIARIVSSPLQRTVGTAELIRDGLGLETPIETDERFIERHVGSAVGMPKDEYYTKEADGVQFDGLEPVEDMISRVESAFEELLEDGRDVLLVTHSGTHRMLECALQDLPADKFTTVRPLANGEVVIYEFTEN